MSLGLTAVGLVVLSVAGPVPCGTRAIVEVPDGAAGCARRSASFRCWCSAYFYMQAAKAKGPLRPVWEGLSNPWSPAHGGLIRLGRSDHTRGEGWAAVHKPGRLSVHTFRSRGLADGGPGVVVVRANYRQACGLLRSVWPMRQTDRETIGMERARDDRRGWLLLASLFLVGGIAGPDSFGTAHGEFLPQRVLLLGLIALVPVFDADFSRWPGRFLLAVIAVAVALQSAIVWDYALYSDATAGQIIRAGTLVGRNQRIVTLLVTSQGRFRANPLFTLKTGWESTPATSSGTTTRRCTITSRCSSGPSIERPHPGDLELVSIHEDPKDKATRRRDWEKILRDHAKSIDVVLFWKSDPELEAITERWFEMTQRTGDVRIFRRIRSIVTTTGRGVDPDLTILGW